MNSHVTSAQTSFDEKERPFESAEPSDAGDIEAHADTLPRRTPTNRPRPSGEGAPLDISPSHLSVPPQPDIPNGGFTAWLQVACGFLMFFNSW